MPTGFHADLTAARRDVDGAREEVVATLSALSDTDLDRSRRGGWPVGRVIQHLVQGEAHYAHLVRRLRDLPPAPAPEPPEPPGSVAEAIRALTASRQALLDGLDGVDEAAFYRLTSLGREEYSVLSVLENVAHHDREHAQQIRSIVAAG
jgi:uncharacterized damage-inducible protein DinB